MRSGRRTRPCLRDNQKVVDALHLPVRDTFKPLDPFGGRSTGVVPGDLGIRGVDNVTVAQHIGYELSSMVLTNSDLVRHDVPI
jgi:hypothetical protein